MPTIDWSSIFSFQNSINTVVWAVVLAIAGWIWQKAGGREIWRGKSWLYWPVSILSVFVILTAVSHPQMPDFSRSDIAIGFVGVTGNYPSSTAITFEAAIRNVGAESAIDSYQAELVLATGTKVEGRLIPPSNITLNRPTGDTRPPITFPEARSLVPQTLNPISRGRIVTGVITFIFDGVRQEDAGAAGSKIIVTFRDVFGRKYTMSHFFDGKNFE